MRAILLCAFAAAFVFLVSGAFDQTRIDTAGHVSVGGIDQWATRGALPSPPTGHSSLKR